MLLAFFSFAVKYSKSSSLVLNIFLSETFVNMDTSIFSCEDVKEWMEKEGFAAYADVFYGEIRLRFTKTQSPKKD